MPVGRYGIDRVGAPPVVVCEDHTAHSGALRRWRSLFAVYDRHRLDIHRFDGLRCCRSSMEGSAAPETHGCSPEHERYYAVMMFVLLMQAAVAAQGCHYDRAALMALDEDAFDQDMAGGWRKLEYDGCEAEAADLIRDWRVAHKAKGHVLV